MMDWFPDWRGEIAAIVASGSSAGEHDLQQFLGRCRVAVVNNSYKLAPWADLLYAADDRWWDVYKPEFSGLKVAAKEATARNHRIRSINLIGDIDTDDDRMVLEPKGMIARGGNSAFQLVNLITQFGCTKQIWIGFDFCGSHWHEDHPKPLINPRQRTLDKWCRRLDAQAPFLESAGVSVVVVSKVSRLTAYRKVETIDGAFEFHCCRDVAA